MCVDLSLWLFQCIVRPVSRMSSVIINGCWRLLNGACSRTRSRSCIYRRNWNSILTCLCVGFFNSTSTTSFVFLRSFCVLFSPNRITMMTIAVTQPQQFFFLFVQKQKHWIMGCSSRQKNISMEVNDVQMLW